MNESTLEYLSARQYVYLVMQRLFGTEPTDELIDALNTEVLAEAMAVLLDGVSDEEGLAEAANLVERIENLQGSGACDDARVVAREQLHSEYARCFVGPADLPTPPFESVHTDRRRILMTETTLKVRRTYQASGFEPELCRRVPDDHVALELDFLAALARGACESAARGGEATCAEYLKTSLKFITEHLGRWVAKFARAMAQKSDSPFYTDAARCLVQCIAADQQKLAALNLSGRQAA